MSDAASYEVRHSRPCFLVLFLDDAGLPRAWAHGGDEPGTVEVATAHARAYLQNGGSATLQGAEVRRFLTCPNLGLGDEPIEARTYRLGPDLEFLDMPSR